MTYRIFGREPAAALAFIAVAIKLVAAFGINLTVDQQSVLNAVAATAVGLLVAVSTRDGVAAALYGFAQAALALAVGFGLHWSADQQAVVLSFVSVAVAMFVRTQVTAKVPGAVASGPTGV
jgi:uncharacterized membrane protein